MRIGVLAMQGAFEEHLGALSGLDVDALEVRKASDLENIDGLIIPGGESTAIGKLLDIFGIKSRLNDKISSGLPVWGTCAGMILLAKRLAGGEKVHIPLMDVEVTRNGYGRQLGSFEAFEEIRGMEGGAFPMIFIRAPYISGLSDGVEVLGSLLPCKRAYWRHPFILS